jgi:hypothetical protein
MSAAGETETMQDNIQDWLELDEEDHGFQLLTQEETGAVIFLLNFISTTYIIKFSIYLFSRYFCLLGLPIFFFINLDYHLIQLTYPPGMWISEGLL